MTALDGRVWSSGGRGRGARLREWSMSGALHADVDLSTAGAGFLMGCEQRGDLVAWVYLQRTEVHVECLAVLILAGSEVSAPAVLQTE